MFWPFAKPLFLYFAVAVLLAGFVVVVFGNNNDDPAEQLFRQAMMTFRQKTRNDPTLWDSWYEITPRLLALETTHPLPAIGGFEESILVIEQATVAAGEGDDPKRDAALSHLYHGYAQLLMSLDAEQCIQLALSPHNLLIGSETARRDQPSDKLCTENAENSLRNAITLDATNQQAEKLLAQLLGNSAASGGGVHERKPKEFVAALFDDFADTFDEKLGKLGYIVPGLVGEAAKDFLQSSTPAAVKVFGSALDAGCGTGLAGPYLRPLVGGKLIGVDASAKMLDLASKCTTTTGCGQEKEEDDDTNNDNNKQPPLYDGLLELDLEDMTLENTLHAVVPGAATKFDLITAADVLVYFGQLDNIFNVFARLSSPHAALIFSCERAAPEEAPLGWRLLSSGRFAHTKQHAIDAAQKVGYELVSYQEIVPRMEKGQEVKGHLFTFVLSKLKSSPRNDEL